MTLPDPRPLGICARHAVLAFAKTALASDRCPAWRVHADPMGRFLLGEPEDRPALRSLVDPCSATFDSVVCMTITPDLVEAYVKCPTKCFLRSRGETGEGNAYADWVNAQNTIYRHEGIRRLKEGVANSQCVTGPLDTKELRSGKWCLATESTVRAQALECTLHAVERAPIDLPGRPAQFIPTRFIFANKLGGHDKLLLAFDALALSQALGRQVDLGKIIHGDDHVTLKIRTAALDTDLRKITAKIGTLLTGQAAPDLVLNRHCPECEFQKRCRQKAIDKDDLSLLGSMTEKERADFNSKGIFTVTQLSFTFRPRRRPRGLKDRRERHHYALKALAIREKKLHIVGSPEFKVEGTPVYLDVEGLPDRGFYYLVGLRTKAGDSMVQHSLWADGPSDEGRVWQEFLSRLMEIDNPVLIHYGSFESVFLKRMREKHGGPPNGSHAAKALDSSVNLLSVIFGQIYFPTYSNGLKDVAGWLGFKWSVPDSSGLQSIVWREEWQQSKAPLIKRTLITYNSEDCAALEVVAHAVGQVCQSGIGSGSELSGRLEVVVADEADAKVTLWRTFSSSIDGFEALNKAARWDYQRDRVYIRTDVELKKAKRKHTTVARRTLHISKVVVCEPLRICPRCQRGTHKYRAITRDLHDLRFTKSGVTGWVVKYHFQVLRCSACRALTPQPKEFFWDGRSTYGRNLAAFSIFEIIELCVSQRSVTESLNRLFGFQVDHNVVRRFKEHGAEYYQGTREKILAAMVAGNVIHADETRIRLHGKAGYVWVFTTTREVVYFYSETREGNLVQNALAGFNGVLVSDFYAAYDSMPCPQQKCLLHLMRDLNDAVLDNPYDNGVREIVTAFAELLRGIVTTIDRWGLKSLFLRKHLVDVARFYRQLPKTGEVSAATLKLKDRFDTNRDKLFTFLEHDGVTWNNNNAEHAIKAFARLRRAIEGLSTPKGIEEYLILLSVCQTCKYSGLDFLAFLRSGETDIGAFAARQRKRSSFIHEDRTEPGNGGDAE
jgi:predicted RecB family nuclease